LTFGAKLFFPPDTIRTHIKGLAHTRDRVDTVFAKRFFIRTINLGGMLTAVCFSRKKERFRTFLIGPSVSV